jgi:prophage antirepressor-like protein
LCEALGIENSRDAVRSLNPDERITVAIPDGNRGNPNKTLVNESGFYKLAFKSRRPEAERFRDWVTGTVLPAIRKGGACARVDYNRKTAADLHPSERNTVTLSYPTPHAGQVSWKKRR